MTRLRIRTPSRLHFGLLGWGPQAPRQFGGVGLMIEAPGIELIAELTRLGLMGAGQSSWGPTLYAFGAISELDQRSVASRILDRWGLPPSAVLWTRAANHGAVLDRAAG